MTMRAYIRVSVRWAALLTLLFSLSSHVHAAPSADLWGYWLPQDVQSTMTVDHSPWGAFLKKYLVADHPSGVNRVRYGEVTGEDQKQLAAYIDSLTQVPPRQLNRATQLAYWINLYNALTVKVILDEYPVDSIRDIRSGFFTAGPWKMKLVEIAGEEVSLDEIEHRILRPIWKDNRIHYAVNCASIGCPNLIAEPFTPENSERLLEQGARSYVNHPRGVGFSGDDLVLSSIYDWFSVDFGSDEKELIAHLLKYAEPPLAEKLKAFKGDIDYGYDWTLNR